MKTVFAGKQGNRKGFTFIELLVAMAIILILAAILFPVFAQAREKARQASCASKLKQIGLCILQYAQDYDKKFPHANYAGDAVTGNFPWQQLIDPYVKGGYSAGTVARVVSA